MSEEMGALLGVICGLAICFRRTLSNAKMRLDPRLRKALIRLTTCTIAVVVIIIIAALFGKLWINLAQARFIYFSIISNIPKSLFICCIKLTLGLVGIGGPIFSKNTQCKIAPEPWKLNSFSGHFIFSKLLFSLAILKFSCVLFVLFTYPVYNVYGEIFKVSLL